MTEEYPFQFYVYTGIVDIEIAKKYIHDILILMKIRDKVEYDIFMIKLLRKTL